MAEQIPRSVQDALLSIYTPTAARVWLNDPNDALEGRSPAQMIAEGNVDAVLDVLDGLIGGDPE